MPDLQIGDGYTQIAYNPMDAENVKMVVQYYRKHLSEMPTDISVDQYMDMAGKDGQELLDELAEKGYTEGMHIEQLAEIQERIQDVLPELEQLQEVSKDMPGKTVFGKGTVAKAVK